MAVNQQTKRAMKRLAFDQEELLRSPVEGVSAVPLDENMLEWHCNFEFDDVIYHVVLFFPETYPYKSPSAEFVPSGFQFVGGATKQGKKGTQVRELSRVYFYFVLFNCYFHFDFGIPTFKKLPSVAFISYLFPFLSLF